MNPSTRPAPQTAGYSDDVTEGQEQGEGRGDWLTSTNYEFVYG
jgi:hypothetical protein